MSQPEPMPPSAEAPAFVEEAPAAKVIAVLAHDLRNPLQAIRLAAQFLEDAGHVAEPGRRALGRILVNTTVMGKLISDLLDVSQVRTTGVLSMNLRPARLRHIVEQAVEAASGTWPQRHFELVTTDDGDGSFDPDRLAQLISNLLANAVSHGSAAAPVRLTVERVEGRALLHVENDNREGHVPGDLNTHLLQPFQRQVDQPNRSKGLGLGLFIVEQIARGHAGEVRVESTPRTTRVTVRFPAEAR